MGRRALDLFPQTLAHSRGVPPPYRLYLPLRTPVRWCNIHHANSLFSRVQTLTPKASSVLPGAPAPCAQTANPLEDPNIDFLPALLYLRARQPSRPSALGPQHSGGSCASRARQGLTCWEQMGAGRSKSRGEARHGASPYRSSSNTSSHRGGSRRTRGRRHRAPMAPSTVAERDQELGAQGKNAGAFPLLRNPIRQTSLPASNADKGRAAPREGLPAGCVLRMVPP